MNDNIGTGTSIGIPPNTFNHGEARMPKPAARAFDRLSNSDLRISLLLLISYFLLVAYQIRANLYFDELYTFYIARASSLQQMLKESQTIDLHPPLVYTVVRIWQSIFGAGETVARVPTAIAFLLACFGYYKFLKPRLGKVWAASAIMLFWTSPTFIYATELRPYAFVLMFFSLALCGWDGTHKQNRTNSLLLLTLGGIGLTLSHVCGIFALAAIGVAELITQLRSKRVDISIWCSFLPAIGLVVYNYFHLVHNLDVVLWPKAFQAGPRRLAIFFYKELKGLWLQFLLIVVAARLVTSFHFRKVLSNFRLLSVENLGLIVGLLSVPLILNALLMVGQKAFFERYAIETSLAVSILAIVTLAAISGFNQRAGVLVLITLLCFGLWTNPIRRAWWQRKIAAEPKVFQFKPDLPFVVSSGLVFLELDHYESSTFLSRVHYLTDRDAAARLSHTTVFEVMPQLRQYFPIRSQITPYSSFIARTHHFVMLANPDWPEEWLTKKLLEDGATIRPLSKELEKYKLFSTVFEVKLKEERSELDKVGGGQMIALRK